MTRLQKRPRNLRDVGSDLLGPLVNLYLLRLHAHLLQSDPCRDRILFVLRAGHRIKSLYETWLKRRGHTLPAHAVPLRSSRLMACKAAYGSAPDLALTALGQELDGESLDTIIRALLRAESPCRNLDDLSPVPQQPLHEFLCSDNPAAKRVRRHLHHQSRLFSDYLDALAGTAERLVLVDTGWRGTQQLLLEQAFPNWDWSGLYFGCIDRANVLGKIPRRMTGLMFDSPGFDPENPVSGLVLHRHLIESLLEPSIRSVERIDHADIEAVRHGRPECSNHRELPDGAYEGLIAYIAAHASDNPREIMAAYELAVPRLTAMITAPEPADIHLLALKPRSIDLGRIGSVSVVMPAKDRAPDDTPKQRLHEALWGPGQAAIEFDDSRRQRAQKSLQVQATCPPRPDEPSVAIITRTKDRPLLLKRAARSVAGQSYRNILWIVVNDGGDPEPVREVLDESLVDPTRIIFISHEQSLGMEAASNAGIRSCSSDLIVIHDDDDSWEPGFLEQSVAFLDRHGQLYDGVVCHSTYIEEVIADGAVAECGRHPFNDWLCNVQIAEMAVANLFPPIAFLFRRGVWARLDGFDETLPVLGDWDFNLRFLMEADIGVLPLALANYHHRTGTGHNDTYANSNSGNDNPHVAFSAILRNRYLRRAASEPRFAVLAGLIGHGYGLGDLRSRLLSAAVPVNPTESHTASALETEIESLKARCMAQEQELDRRWVLLQMTVSEIISTRGLSVETGALIRQLSSLADQYTQKTVIQPPPDFDEAAYRTENPDIARAVADGKFKNAFDHFAKLGRRQGRRRPYHGTPAGREREALR